MAVGQVGFKDQRKVCCMCIVIDQVLIVAQVKRVYVEKRENAIINRLNKTKEEKYPDLREEKEARLKELGKRDRDAQQARVCALLLPPLVFCFLLRLFSALLPVILLRLFLMLLSLAPSAASSLLQYRRISVSAF
jgi:hypothetical protein